MNLFSFFRKNKDVQKFPSKKLQKIVNNAIHFLNKSPSHSLSTLERFGGSGVYVLYYNGSFYDDLLNLDLDTYFLTSPIYVGKAVSTGWRSGRVSKKSSNNLWRRIQEHINNISQISNLNLSDFYCKYIILDDDLISPIEAKLIRTYKPIWNGLLWGFGNHFPGINRLNQAKSDWDVLHSGRSFAENMKNGNSEDIIVNRIKRFMENI